MGGVYRIQTFFGFLYFFYIYKAPKLTVLPHAYRLLVCWYMLLLCDVSKREVSTQPKLTVLPHAYRLLVCWYVVVV